MERAIPILPADDIRVAKEFYAEKGKDGLAALGDLACWYNDKHEELHAFKGTNFISVELRGSQDPTKPIKSVMKTALDRLK